MLSCHCHSQEQMQVLWDTRNKCLLNIYYEDTFPDGLDGKESACNGGDLGSIPGLEESSMDSGARGHYALVLVSLSWLTLGTVFWSFSYLECTLLPAHKPWRPSDPTSAWITITIFAPNACSVLLPCHSLTLNSAHDLSHILVSYFIDWIFIWALCCFESVRSKVSTESSGYLESRNLPLLSWTRVECRIDPRGELPSPSKERWKTVPGANKHLHWAFLKDSKIYSFSTSHYKGYLRDWGRLYNFCTWEFKKKW